MIKNKPIGVLIADQQLSMTDLLCLLPIAQSSLRLQGKYIYYLSKHRKRSYAYLTKLDFYKYCSNIFQVVELYLIMTSMEILRLA